MRPFGAREAMGGAPGDAYGAYKGIEASNIEGLGVLFNHARVSIVFRCWTVDIHSF